MQILQLVVSAEVVAKPLHDIRPLGIPVLEDFDVQPGAVRVGGQIAAKMIDAIETAAELSNLSKGAVKAPQAFIWLIVFSWSQRSLAAKTTCRADFSRREALVM